MSLRELVLALAGGAALASVAPSARAEAPSTPAPIVFFDIVAPDLSKEAAFYSEVFGWKVGADGHVIVGVSAPLEGVFRIEQEQVGPERVLYLGVADIDAALKAIKDHGGAVVFPRVAVPGVAYIALFKDPAGNRMGLVEMQGGKARIPPVQK
ncbi:MAG TPA: VOC family protein [Caulobacteraceae bacterium]|nr:VOC family protein [Caulobacteraceae bacterium]